MNNPQIVPGLTLTREDTVLLLHAARDLATSIDNNFHNVDRAMGICWNLKRRVPGFMSIVPYNLVAALSAEWPKSRTPGKRTETPIAIRRSLWIGESLALRKDLLAFITERLEQHLAQLDIFEKTILMPRWKWATWDKALRSGGYKQGKHQLAHQNDTGELVNFCCLGVMQHCLTGDVERQVGASESDPRGLPTSKWLEEHGITFNGSGFETTPILMHSDYGDILSASMLNDEKDYSFEQIADLIALRVEFPDEQ